MVGDMQQWRRWKVRDVRREKYLSGLRVESFSDNSCDANGALLKKICTGLVQEVIM